MHPTSSLPLSSLNDCPEPDGPGLTGIHLDPGEPLGRAFQPFPVDCFPSTVRNYVTSVAAALDCDLAFVALPVLSTLAAAIGNRHRLSIKRFWSEPAVVWTALVSEGRTDTRLSMDAATNPFGVQFRKNLVRDGRLNALVPTLEREQVGLLMRLDHLDGWLGRPNSTSGRRMVEVSQWADIHGSRPLSMERRGRQIEISSPAISLLGTVQGQVLSDKFLKARVPCELTSRLLFAAPPSRPRRWTDADVSEEIERAYTETVLALGARDTLVADDITDKTDKADRTARSGHPTKRAEDFLVDNQEACTTALEVQMSPEAKALFTSFVDWVGREQLDVDEVLGPWFTQLASHAARLALVVHLTRWAQGESVDRMECDAASLRAGITMARWFAEEAQRVIAVFSVDRDEQEQQRIIEWIRRRGGLATSRDLCRSNSRRYPTDEIAQQALDQLAESGVGVWVDFPPGKNGGRGYRALSLGPVCSEPQPQRTESGDESPQPTVAACETESFLAAEELVRQLVRRVVSDNSGEIAPASESNAADLRSAVSAGSGDSGRASAVMPQRSCVGQKCRSRKMKRRAARKGR